MDPKNVKCDFCSIKGGAYHKTATGWVHNLCAMWVKPWIESVDGDISLLNTPKLLLSNRGKLICKICGEGGICIQCSSTYCFVTAHPYCLMSNNSYKKRTIKRSDVEDNCWEMFCPNHLQKAYCVTDKIIKGKGKRKRKVQKRKRNLTSNSHNNNSPERQEIIQNKNILKKLPIGGKRSHYESEDESDYETDYDSEDEIELNLENKLQNKNDNTRSNENEDEGSIFNVCSPSFLSKKLKLDDNEDREISSFSLLSNKHTESTSTTSSSTVMSDNNLIESIPNITEISLNVQSRSNDIATNIPSDQNQQSINQSLINHQINELQNNYKSLNAFCIQLQYECTELKTKNLNLENNIIQLKLQLQSAHMRTGETIAQVESSLSKHTDNPNKFDKMLNNLYEIKEYIQFLEEHK